MRAVALWTALLRSYSSLSLRVVGPPTPITAAAVFLWAGQCLQWAVAPPNSLWWSTFAVAAALAFARFQASLALALSWLALGGLAVSVSTPDQTSLSASAMRAAEVQNEPPRAGRATEWAPYTVTFHAPPEATERGWRARGQWQLVHNDAPPSHGWISGAGAIPHPRAHTPFAARARAIPPYTQTNPSLAIRPTPLPTLRLHPQAPVVPLEERARPAPVREQLRQAAAHHMPAERRALAEALLLGDGGGVPALTRRAFDDTGTSHLLAVSGLHLAWVGGFVYWLAWLALRQRQRWLELGTAKRAAVLSGAAAAAAFAIFTGGKVSVFRAATMACASALALATSRPATGQRAIALAFVALLITSPLCWLSAGFQLSFASVMALTTASSGSPPRAERIHLPKARVPSKLSRSFRWLVAALAAATVAHLATVGFTAHHFGRISLGAPLCNLAAVPYFGVAVMPAAVLAALGTAVGGIAESAGFACLDWALRGLVWLVETMRTAGAAKPMTSITLVSALLSLFAALAAVAHWRRPLIASPLAALLLAGAWCARAPGPQPGHLTITALDIGHGDATLVQTEEVSILIDGGGHGGIEAGPSIARRVVTPALRALGVSHLDAAVLSHPDGDHLLGLWEALRHTPTRALYAPEPHELIAAELAMYAEATMRGATIHWVHAGQKWHWDNIEVRALAPPLEASPRWNRNERSVVLELNWREFRALLTGDIEEHAEAWLVHTAALRPAQVVKVPHHGSRTSSSPALVQILRPQLALVSTDYAAGYGLPHQEVLQRWVDSGAQVLRTDILGAIQVVTNGTNLKVRTYAPSSPNEPRP